MGLDFDDYLFAGHTGHSAVLASLAYAEREGLPGRDLLCAATLANEVGGRLGAAFLLGPRWSVAYGSTSLGDLFDSSLTNQDPTLASLRAQSGWARLDGTVGQRWVVANIGLGWAGDDNVGVFHSSTIARAHLRVTPFNSRSVTVGLQTSHVIGGSVPSRGAGRQAVDVTVKQGLSPAVLSYTVGASRGALWRLSEALNAYGAGVQGILFDHLEVGVSMSRYTTTYGASTTEWYRAASAAVRVDRVRFGTRYVSTRLGAGSGFALSLEYGRRSP